METQPSTENTEHEALTSTADTSVLNLPAKLISHFEDDPYWDEMMDSIRRHRREMDTAWAVAECT